jgi:hypothetical protein
MIAYNKIWLANQRLQNEVKKETEQGRVSNDEFKAITEKYPVGFYTPNIFVRAGLFILTCVIVSFADGLLSLMAAGANVIESGGWFFFLGLLSYIALEIIVNTKHHYRSGVDDALLIISGGLFTTFFAIMLYHNGDTLYHISLSGFIFLLAVGFSIRFADMLTAITCCISLLAFVFFLWTRTVPAGLSTAPFIMMLVSGVMYWLSHVSNSRKAFINYQNCLTIAEAVSLAALYTAGNYYIIQTLSSELMGKTGPVPFGTVFWIWTILLPFVYIGFGIKNKDVILLRVGLLLITAAALTFRTYYHIMPVDIALTLSGITVLAVVFGVIKYLKAPKHGFTNAEPDDVNLLDHLKIESLIVAETFSHAPAAPVSEGVKFNGGDFGGGGSSGGF